VKIEFSQMTFERPKDNNPMTFRPLRASCFTDRHTERS